MLASEDKAKIEKYIDKVLRDINKSVRQNIRSGKKGQQAVDMLVNTSAKKLASESKAILSSTYNMLKDHTFSEAIYEDPSMKAAFFEADILTQISSKFNFDVPKHVDYQESEYLVEKLIAAGVIVVVAGSGGYVSIKLKSPVPFGIAIGIIIAVVAATAIYKKFFKKDGSSDDLSVAIDKYLDSVKISLIKWVESIEQYYDEQVEKLEKGQK